MNQNRRGRLHLLDAFRGFLMLNMIAFHGMWDLVYLFGVDAPWYAGTPKYLWQQFICWSFILLSGFCWKLSRSHLRRGALVFGGGILISLVTLVLMPENRILFGVLTCIGSCMLLMIPLEKLLAKVPAGLGLLLSFAAFFLTRNFPAGTVGFEGIVLGTLPEGLYRNLLTAYLGFPPPEFWSTDYFPLLPWLFLFVTGYFLFRLLDALGVNHTLFGRGKIPVLNALGRNSLFIYLLHQPALYGVCMVWHYLIR